MYHYIVWHKLNKNIYIQIKHYRCKRSEMRVACRIGVNAEFFEYFTPRIGQTREKETTTCRGHIAIVFFLKKRMNNKHAI